MAGNKSAKGNPAHKRMSNLKLKASRAASWKRGQLRKEANRKSQEARESLNRKLRASGAQTPREALQSANLNRVKRVLPEPFHRPVYALFSNRTRFGTVWDVSRLDSFEDGEMAERILFEHKDYDVALSYLELQNSTV